MLESISRDMRKEYVSPNDTTNPKTIFVFRPLSGAEVLEFQQSILVNKMMVSADNLLSYLGKCVVEIKNGPAAGTSIRESLELMPAFVLMELMQEANRLNHLTEDDKKNSADSSTEGKTV